MTCIDVDRSLELMAAAEGPCAAAARITAGMFGTTLQHLRGRQQTELVTRARHLAMWAAYRSGGVSYAQIGRYFGDRDSSTVIGAAQRIDGLMEECEPFRETGNRILSRMGIEAA